MFKSPGHHPIAKKGPISFIKTIGSPKHSNSTKYISPQANNFTIDQYSKEPGRCLLSIQIRQERVSEPHRCVYTYQHDTTIQQLLTFLYRQLDDKHIYFKSRNLNIDYLITLESRKVRELGVKKLELSAFKIRVFPRNSLLNNFEIIKCVGTGGFSRVYLCRGFGKLVALKVIGKQFIVENQKQNIVQSQRNILERCSGHPFITKLYTSFETQNYLIFCMEYCNGGELFNLLRKVRRMSEEQAKFYFLQTLAAISHLHSQRILYRDLKPQNIIIDSDGHIRLADYGLSKIMKDEMTHSFCGSAEYMAPEMLMKKGHSFQIDYYCLGALLYELVYGLPPYYSRNHNQLFNNILTKDLEFPDNVEISKELKKFLHRMLEKDTDMRFKTISEIMKHPWLTNVNMDDVLNKKLVPPFQTDMFENNFDSSDFEKDEEKQILKLQRQKDRCHLQPNEVVFQGFTYVAQELDQLQKEIIRENQKKIDFSKKPSQVVNVMNGEKSLLRTQTMKSIDTSQFYIERQQQQSPRMVHNQNTHTGRSGEKLKMFVSQASKIGSSTYGSQHITPQLSTFGTHPKTSEILNGSRQSSGIFNTSGSKLLDIRGTPYISKNQQYSSSPMHQRMGSPININNYINIYTNKSPPKGPQISFTTPIQTQSSQLKKPQYLSNNSYDKNINSSYKNTSNSYGSINGSLERAKFSSLDKPVLYGSNSGTFLRNSPYCHNLSPDPRGYLTNFRDRMNPSHKIKKSYKSNDKMSFNFFSPHTPYSRN